MKKRVSNLSASVRQRLLNLATERKEDFGLGLDAIQMCFAPVSAEKKAVFEELIDEKI